MTTWTTVDRVVLKDSICHMQEAVAGEVKALFLCYPDAAGHSANDISILSPLGVSVLGCREGEQVVTEEPQGKTPVCVA